MKDASYHRAAIEYNEGLAVYAAELAETLEHEEIQKWCRSVSKQHRFHAGRHKKALAKLENEETPDSSNSPVPTAPTTGVETTNLAEEQALFAKEREELDFEYSNDEEIKEQSA